MQIRSTLRIKVTLQMIAITTLAACAAHTKQMTSLPPTTAEAGRAVVLFRVRCGGRREACAGDVVNSPRWKWHYRVNVGPTGQPLDTERSLAPGQLDAASMDAGWGFLTLPPGAYQLAFAAYRTSFTMLGAQRGALGFGQSQAARLEVPADAPLLYVGTFAFTCEPAARWWFYEEHLCRKLGIRDDAELARQVASTSLTRFVTMRIIPASTR